MKTVTVKNLVLGQGMPKICIPITGENKETMEKFHCSLPSGQKRKAEHRKLCMRIM